MSAVEVPDRLTAEQAAEVLAKHERMYWHIARRYGIGFGPEDLEDLAAEARRWFVRAAQTFEPSRRLEFSTYAYTAAVSGARRMARRIRARGMTLPRDPAAPTPKHVSWSHRLGAGDGFELGDTVASPVPEERIAVPADFWDRIRSQLTARQFACLTMRFCEGLMLREAGKRIGTSHELVRVTCQRALKKLRDSGLFDEYEGLL